MPLNTKNINKTLPSEKNGSVYVTFARDITHQKHLAQSRRSTRSAVDIFNTLRIFTKEPIREQEIKLECMMRFNAWMKLCVNMCIDSVWHYNTMCAHTPQVIAWLHHSKWFLVIPFLFIYFIHLAKTSKWKKKDEVCWAARSTKSTKEHYHRKVQCSQLSRTQQIIIKEKLYTANKKCHNYKKWQK